jgi:hypothetical protein
MNPLISSKDKPQVGDIVLQSPANGTPYEAQILEMDQHSNTCKLLKDIEGTFSERVYEVPLNTIWNAKREYKVINLTKYPADENGEAILVAELSYFKKRFIIMGHDIRCTFSFDATDTDVFVFPFSSEIAQYLMAHPEETININHKMYYIEKDFILNGQKMKASFIFQPEQRMPTQRAFVKRSKYLFVHEE